MKRKKFLSSSYITKLKIFAFEVYPFPYFQISLNPVEGGRSCFSTPTVPFSSFTLSLTFRQLYVRRAAMMVPVGLIGKLWSFVSFLSFFLFLLVLGLLKGIIFLSRFRAFHLCYKVDFWWFETKSMGKFETQRYLLTSNQVTCNCIYFLSCHFHWRVYSSCIFCLWYSRGFPSLSLNLNLNLFMASNTYVAFGLRISHQNFLYIQAEHQNFL